MWATFIGGGAHGQMLEVPDEADQFTVDHAGQLIEYIRWLSMHGLTATGRRYDSRAYFVAADLPFEEQDRLCRSYWNQHDVGEEN